MTKQEAFIEYEIALNELKAIESSEGNFPAYRYNALLTFANNRANKLFDEIYPE